LGAETIVSIKYESGSNDSIKFIKWFLSKSSNKLIKTNALITAALVDCASPLKEFFTSSITSSRV